jgi:3-deoxy-D-manno-octulosonic-acid transferase
MILYRIAISLYFAAIRFAAFFRKDAARWVEGRRQWREGALQLNPERKKSIWIHVSSLGEFEQGRPLIERIRQQYPGRFIWLSFFSPSGYEIRKNYPGADAVSYFPSDRLQDVRDFLEMVNPSLAIFVKYDFWFESLHQLRLRNIPFVFVSMHLHPRSYLRKYWAKPLVRILRSGKHFFVQNEETRLILDALGISNATVCGDTRLDRVLEIAGIPLEDPAIEDFCSRGKILVAGSVWTEDLRLLSEVLASGAVEGWKIIVAPHQTDAMHVGEVSKVLSVDCELHSSYHLSSRAGVMIVDSVGKLAAIYARADLCYVGGGFGRSIHNILEPAAHLKPVCFGPAHAKFPEAAEFIQSGFGFEVNHFRDLIALMKKAEDRDWSVRTATSARSYMNMRKGATDFILEKLAEQGLIA